MLSKSPRAELVQHLKLSPARAALRDRLAGIAQARRDVADARMPLDRISSALAKAKTRQEAARGVLGAVKDQEADDLARWVDDDVTGRPRPPLHMAERSAANVEIEASDDEVSGLEIAFATRRAALQPAIDNIAALAAATDTAILPILAEEFEISLAAATEARAAYLIAEARVIGLRSGCAARGRSLVADRDTDGGIPWFRAAERFAEAQRLAAIDQSDLTTGMIDASTRRWENFATRLLADPAAEALA